MNVAARYILFLILVFNAAQSVFASDLIPASRSTLVAKDGQTCTASYQLPQNEWRMISLPCEPPSGEDTVQDIFGDDISTAYGTDWAVFGYDPTGYKKQTLASKLEQGKGYWIVSTAGSATLDLPVSSQHASLNVLAESPACMSEKGCFESSISATGSDSGWNLFGHPYLSGVAISQLRVVTDGTTSPNDCGDANGCTLDEAETDGVFHNQFWVSQESSASGYVALASADKLAPWMGFWGAALDNAVGKNPRLLMPSPATTSGSNLLVVDEGFENGIDQWRAVPAFFNMSNESREGNQSIRFLPDTSGGKRSELVLKDRKGDYAWGKEYWVGFSINMQKHMVDEGPEDKRNFKIISQHHSIPRNGANGKPDWNLYGGPNGFTIRAEDGLLKIFTTTKAENVDKVLPISGGAVTGTEVRYSHPYNLNTWYDFVLHFRYAPDDSGIMEVFINGDKKIDVHGPTMYKYALVGKEDPLSPYPVSHRQYQKIGMYHGNGARNGEILYDAFRIGGPDSSYQDVAPR